MEWFINQWRKNGTKWLGTVTSIVAGLQTIPGLVPSDQLKYWSAAGVILGAVTIKRGFTNSATKP